MKHMWIWIAAAVAVLYVLGTKQNLQTGQEAHTPVSSTNAWSVAGGWYSQHFPFGAQ